MPSRHRFGWQLSSRAMDIKGKLVVAAVTHDETRIWATDAKRGDSPTVVARPSAEHIHHHVRQGQGSHGHESNRFEQSYYEGISKAIDPASQILIVGHGKGKANSMFRFFQHMERHHSKTAQKIVGAIDLNLPALSEPQLLAAAREWYAHHREL